MCRSNCSHDSADIQSAGRVTVFKSDNLSSPSDVITGSAQFTQLGAYVTLANYVNRDVIVVSATAAGTQPLALTTDTRSASGCVVECRICNREVAGSNLGLSYFAPRSTQPSIPPGSVNEYQLRLGWQRQVWLIPIADERVGVQVKL